MKFYKMKTYTIIQRNNEIGIKCHICGLTSYNKNDVKNKFCGHCNIFHNDENIHKIKLFYQYEMLGKKCVFTTIKELSSFIECDIENLEQDEKLKIEITPICMTISDYLKLKEFEGY